MGFNGTSLTYGWMVGRVTVNNLWISHCIGWMVAMFLDHGNNATIHGIFMGIMLGI
jgi:hypothetical protein